jgi:hypothetical protein
MATFNKIFTPLLLIAVAILGYQLLRPPVYTVEVRFQIPEPGLMQDESRPHLTVPGCMSEIKSRDFLVTTLAKPEIGNSAWCRSLRDRLHGLDEALQASALPDPAQFRLRLTITHRREAHTILNALADAYIEWRGRLSEQQRATELQYFLRQCIEARSKLTTAQNKAKNLIGYTDARALEHAINNANEKLPELERVMNELKAQVSNVSPAEVSSEQARALRIKFHGAERQYNETQALLRRFADNKRELQELDIAIEKAGASLTLANKLYDEQETLLRQQTKISVIQRAAPP